MNITRTIYETKNNIIKTVNESGLPLMVVAYILKDIQEEANMKAAQELEIELRRENKVTENNENKEE